MKLKTVKWKRWAALLLALISCFSLAACSGGQAATTPPADASPEVDPEPPVQEDDWAYIEDKGELLIGITIYEPMNYYNDQGKLIGFDTEFAEAVCAELGVTPKFVEINWDTKEVELAAKTIDCIWNGLTVNEERRENMLFSDPYIKNMQSIVIQAKNADVYTDLNSLADARLVAEISSAGEIAIADDDILAGADYVALAKQTDALLEVKAGTADAAVLDYVLAKAMVGPDTSYADLMVVPGLDLAVEEYAIGFRLGSSAVDVINSAIESLIADGTLGQLALDYGLEAQLIANQ